MTTSHQSVGTMPTEKAPSLWTKFAYGIGAAAYGIKDNGFNYFLLLFYSQVIGVDARLVGLAITIALIIDAISDPIIGYWSDNLRSKWGRRHPFMYAAAIPVAASYFLLWNPPADWTQANLFWFLLVIAILIRTFITIYETPSAALAPELSTDYDHRSALIGYRYFFAWVGGTCMSIMLFFFLFPMFTTETIPSGQFNRDTYQVYGIIAAAGIFITILISALGTHGRIKDLSIPTISEHKSIFRPFIEIWQTLADADFAKLFLGAILGAIATGLSAGLTYYFAIYFWAFSPIQMGMLTVGTLLSSVIGLVLAPIVSKHIGKKRGAIIIGLIAFIGSPLPLFLRLIDVLPENGDPFVFWFVLIAGIIDVGLIICFQILVTSMGADLVEKTQLKTGRRSEGVLSAAMTFIRKCTQGFGLMAASFILALAQFPDGANAGEASAESIWLMGAYYVPTILVIWLIMVAVISTYNIDRKSHEENLQSLNLKK